jgi:hypothetical protein
MLLGLTGAVLTIALAPTGPVLMDGRCDDPVWRRAPAHALGRGSAVRFAADRGFVYLCVTPTPGSFATVDLYLDMSGGRLLQLHASAKLGERLRGPDGQWPGWRWWNHQGWSANTVPFTGERGSVAFAPAEGRELQIAHAKLGRSRRFLLVVSDLRSGAGVVTASFPSTASPTSRRPGRASGCASCRAGCGRSAPAAHP